MCEMFNFNSLIIMFLFVLRQTVLGQNSLRPNIVIIVADDLGWNDVSFHGSDQIPTPNLDALAFNGIVLNNHYVQSTCTPSRAALLTGRYPIHTGMQGGPLYPTEPRGLPLSNKLMSEYMKDLGYDTVAIGKWHLGYHKRQYTPIYRGFDSFMGFYNGYTGFYDYIVQNYIDGDVQNGFDLYRNLTAAWDLVGRYSTDLFTSEAVKVISERRLTSTPLFLYVGYGAVHASHPGRLLEAPQSTVNKFKYILEPNRRTYAAMLAKMDEGVGDIVNALKDANILDNTIILFMSDNGAAPIAGPAFRNWGSNYPLRGAKETLWQGGVRSPSFIWSSNFQQNPRVSQQLIHITDWLPTLFTAAGGDYLHLQEDLDGVDQWYSLTWNLPSRRNIALLNIDEKQKNAGIIAKVDSTIKYNSLWKLVVGRFSNGKYDGIYNDVRSPRNPPYSAIDVINSKAGQALNSIFLPTSSEIQIRILRNQATVNCQLIPEQKDTPPNCIIVPCLFNLELDPCERNDVAKDNIFIAKRLYNALKYYNKRLTPQPNISRDPIRANPAFRNNTWSPWL